MARDHSREGPPRLIKALRSFLTQSDSATQKRRFSTGRFIDWSLLVLLFIVSRVDFVVFVLFLEAVDVREYCCTAVRQSKIGWQPCASRVLREQRGFALEEPSSQRFNGIGLKAESYVRGVALSREPPKPRQA